MQYSQRPEHRIVLQASRAWWFLWNYTEIIYSNPDLVQRLGTTRRAEAHYTHVRVLEIGGQRCLTSCTTKAHGLQTHTHPQHQHASHSIDHFGRENAEHALRDARWARTGMQSL